MMIPVCDCSGIREFNIVSQYAVMRKKNLSCNMYACYT